MKYSNLVSVAFTSLRTEYDAEDDRYHLLKGQCFMIKVRDSICLNTLVIANSDHMVVQRLQIKHFNVFYLFVF